MGYEKRRSLRRFIHDESRISSVISIHYAARWIARGRARYRRRHTTLLNFDMVHLHASTQSIERVPLPYMASPLRVELKESGRSGSYGARATNRIALLDGWLKFVGDRFQPLGEEESFSTQASVSMREESTPPPT